MNIPASVTGLFHENGNVMQKKCDVVTHGNVVGTNKLQNNFGMGEDPESICKE